MGSNENLENLLRSGALKAEAPDRRECEGLLRSAVDRLKNNLSLRPGRVIHTMYAPKCFFLQFFINFSLPKTEVALP